MRIHSVFLSVLIGGVSTTGVASPQRMQGAMAVVEPTGAEAIRLEKTQLGVLSTKRAMLRAGVSARSRSHVGVVGASPDDPISAVQRGVVFNYAMRTFGLFSGEIVFKLVDGVDVKKFDWGVTGLPRPFLGETSYIVSTPTAAEFIRVMTMLQTSKTVRWTEPTIEYVDYAIE